MFRFLTNWRLMAGVLVVAAIVAVAMWPRPIDVDVTHVSRGHLLVTIDEEGETRVRDRFVISSPVAGRVSRIELEPGDTVDRGAPVARLTPPPPTLLDTRARAELAAGVAAAEATLGSTRADRDRAAATLERARSRVQRQRELAKAGAISQDQLEEDETAMRVAEEQRRAAEQAVARAEYEVKLARARLQWSAAAVGAIDIPSPIDGVVLKRLHESEAVVPQGEALLEVGDPKVLEVASDLLSTDAVRIKAGDRVRLEQWGGGMPLAGHVRRVEPAGFMKVSALGVEEQRVNVIIDFDNPRDTAQLGDAYRVEVRVIVSENPEALKVPVGSLFRRGEAWAVFVVEDGRARLRTLELGQRNGLEAEVVSGLSEGEPIIVHPPDTLTEGNRVREREA